MALDRWLRLRTYLSEDFGGGARPVKMNWVINFQKGGTLPFVLALMVVTDTWISMGQAHAETKLKALTPYQVDAALMAVARPDAKFLHCLPAHRGEEVTPEVIDGPQSLIWQEAENRLHAQKSVLRWCFGQIG